MNTEMSISDQLLYIIDETPGISTVEVVGFFEDRQRKEVINCLNRLYAKGVVDRRVAESRIGQGRKPFVYTRAEGPPKPRIVKRSEAKALASDARLEAYRDQIADLLAWQKEAIERYPDLAVPEIVLSARKIVSEQLREDGDFAGADNVMNGSRDKSAIIRATVKALERAAA